MLHEKGIDARVLEGGVRGFTESGHALVTGPNP